MRILIVGDSQAEGPVGRGVQAALQQAGHTVQRIAYVGHGAYDWTRMHWPEYQSALASLRPDQVIMIFGGNDPANANLERAFRQFKASAPKVFYAGPPRYDRRPDVQAQTAAIRDMAKRVFGNKHLDAYPYSGPEVSRAPDGLHFTTTGGRVWAEGILRDWSAALRGGGGIGTDWIAPTVAGGALVFAVGAYLWSRRR